MLKLRNINTLPEVLTIEQVHRLIGSATTTRMFVYFWTVYSMGLRLNEALHLQVGDIDAARGLVHIHRGKGARIATFHCRQPLSSCCGPTGLRTNTNVCCSRPTVAITRSPRRACHRPRTQ